jgi:tyrosinase
VANGIVVRPSAEHANVAALEDAYTKMQAMSESDNRGWIYWAEAHGYNRFECWHHARQGNDQFVYDLFLPWHRAYLLFFDNAARDQNAEAILPWWDWTSDDSHQNGLPLAYRTGGAALESGPMPAINGQPARRTTRNPSNPSGLPSDQQVQNLIDLTDFRDFSNQLQDVHDGVHGWVGGDMGSIGTSAFDPVFWAHHAMIDRIWYLWQLKHGVTNIPPEYLDKALFPGFTVQQVLDARGLGYDYASAAVAAGDDIPSGAAGADAGETPASGDTGGVPADSGGVPPDSGGGPADSGTGTDAGNGTSGGETKPPTTGPKYTSPPLYVGALDPAGSRYDIEFHHVDHAGASYEGRVYLDNPDADENSGYDDPSYAGSYHVFGHGGCLLEDGHCEVKPRRPYDPRPSHPLTPAKKVVIATEPVKRAVAENKTVTVTVVPIIEPLPYDLEDGKYEKDPVGIDYVRVISYR